MKVAAIGLGRMGWFIASHVAQSDDTTVWVHDLNAELCKQWVDEHDGHHAASVADAVRDADLVVTSLPADPHVAAVVDEAIAAIKEHAVWLDHSTISVQGARSLADRLAEASAFFLDAPVSGGVDGAKAGTLTVMVGGVEDALNRVAPVLSSYASRVTYLGVSGAGQLTKMTNQICVVGLCQALAEGLTFAERVGLDVSRVVDVMTKGSSTSWEMENRSAQMIAGEYDFGFSTTLMRKDVGLVLDHAAALDLSLPVTELVASLLDDVDALGGADWDWCSLMERQRAV